MVEFGDFSPASGAEAMRRLLDRVEQAWTRLESFNADVAISQISERNLVIASAAEQQALVARDVDRSLVNIRDLSTQTASPCR